MPRGAKPEEQAPAAAAAPKSARVAARVAAKAEEPAPAAAAAPRVAKKPEVAAPAAKRAGGVLAEAASDDNPAALLGAAVRKRFGSAFFSGKVVSFDTKTRWYFVSYDDGDAEELSAAELAPLLVAKQPKPEKAGKAAAAASAKARGAARGAPKAEAAAPAKKASRAAHKADSEPPAKKARAAAASPAPAPAAAKKPAKKAETAEKAAPAQAERKPSAKASSKAAAAAKPAAAAKAAPAKKASGKAAKAAVPYEQRFFLPLRTQRASRWPSGRPARGLASLAGEWLVYASHHTIPGVESSCCIYGGEALVQSVGTLELKAAGKDRLTGEMRHFQTKVDGAELGPTVPTAGVQVLASEPSERDSPFGIDPGAPSGAYPAIVTGFTDDRFAAQYGEKTPKPMRAWLDLRSGPDEAVPALRTQPAGSGGESDSESYEWDRDMLWPTASSAEAERPTCLDAAAPPLPLRTGDLRFTVRWMERGGHGDAGCEMAYLLRRAPAADGAAAPADAVTSHEPSKPELSWTDYREYRLRDWF